MTGPINSCFLGHVAPLHDIPCISCSMVAPPPRIDDALCCVDHTPRPCRLPGFRGTGCSGGCQHSR